MKTARLKSSSHRAPSLEVATLRARLAEAEETLRAIRGGEVDAVLSASKQGPQVFTLQGDEHAYRMLIESMNEGALTLTSDKTILYANQHFANMVKCPLEQVIGNSFRRFLSVEDRTVLRPLMKRVGNSGSKMQVLLNVCDGSKIPAQISIRPLARRGFNHATIGMVVTDMTEARRTEELLRALTHRVVQVQEVERERVALELHDGITQLLCAILFYSQALKDGLSVRDGSLKEKAIKLREMAGKTAEEVERISRNLHPSVLEQLGLAAALRDTSAEFANRTGIRVKLDGVVLTARLSADAELALYRILQQALRNIEKHARANLVTVQLTKRADTILLTIQDDGMGFDPSNPPVGQKGKRGLGLLGMRERAVSAGGTLKIKSVRHAGTEIEVRIPVPRRVKAPH